MSNTLIFVGRLTRDAERKQGANGAFLTFSVAEDVGYDDKKKTNFWNCIRSGKQAEGNLVDYLVKGAQVQITGEVSFNEVGEKSYNNVSVLKVELVGSRRDSVGSSQAPKPQAQAGSYAQAPRNPAGNVSNFDDGDGLPF